MIVGPNKYGFPTYLVSYLDENEGTHIYCDDPGDYFALRVELACRNTQVVSPLFHEMWETAMKTFRANHGHYPEEVCIKCDPVEAKREQKLWQSKRAKHGIGR
jgi:hypothetical protein